MMVAYACRSLSCLDKRTMEKSVMIRILLVEDNPGDVRLIRHMLHRAPALTINLTNSERLDGNF